MLKIKDDVDLKELAKFGFEYNEDDNYYYNQNFGNTVGYDIIYIEQDRIIQLGFEPCPYFIENYLYDLITAGLVERIEE